MRSTSLDKIKTVARNPMSLVSVQSWKSLGRPVPAPPKVKRRIVAGYGVNYRIGIFVETGTYQGDMVESVRKVLKRIYCVELDS